MAGIYIENIYVGFNNKIVLPAGTAAIVSTPFEVRDTTPYTLTCSTLGVGEEIVVEIYDFSTGLWQNLYADGILVKFSHQHEQICVKDSSMLLRLSKTITASNVGVTMSFSSSNQINYNT